MKNTFVAGMASLLFLTVSGGLSTPSNAQIEKRKVKMITEKLKPGKNDITFASRTMGGELKLAAHLYTPADFDPKTKYPAVVFSGPFNQVKEQTGAVYGRICQTWICDHRV